VKIRPAGAKLFPADRRTDGQTDRHDEADSYCSKFCEHAYKLKVKLHMCTKIRMWV